MIVWKLDQLMRERRIKGRELAKRMGIGENYLSRVRHEVPDRISLALLEGLCEGLGCTIADLIEFRPASAAPAAEAGPWALEATAPRRAAASASVPQVVVPPMAEGEEPAGDRSAARDLFARLVAESQEPAAGALAAEAEPLEAQAPGGTFVRGGALQAKLERLKRRRPD